MKIVGLCLVAGMTCGAFVQSALAQQHPGTSADIKYCNTLARSYSRLFPVQEGMPASDVVTLSRCDSDTLPTIAALEHKLTDKRITLPQNVRIAQPPGASGAMRQ